MIYLASPYTHPDPLEMQYRFHQVCNACAYLMSLGKVVYSPIAHNHYLAQNFSLPHDWNFWQNFDCHMIDRADEVWVFTIDGWHKSVGVQAEIIYAINAGKPVVYFEFDGVLGGKDN